MLSQDLQNALNEQIAHEFHASHLYLGMAAYADEHNLPGFSKWLRSQSDEERAHGLKLFDFVLDRGGHIEMQAVDQPGQGFKSIHDVMGRALEHEQKVTRLINKLYEHAVQENDYATQVQLQWFIREQVEEEKTIGDIVDRLKLAGDESAALLFLDHELGQQQDQQQATSE